MGLALGATGTHPWASYLDQRIIDTPHYNRLRHELGWVAQRNNTWSMHVHMGVRGADRAIAVCDSTARAAAAAACRLGQLALPRSPRQRPAHRSHRDLHPHLSPLWRAQSFRRLGQLRRVRRHAAADRLGGRVNPALVERASTPLLRHGRGADLRRPDARRGVFCPGRPDLCLHRPERRWPTTSTDTTEMAPRCAIARSRRTSGGRSATA